MKLRHKVVVIASSLTLLGLTLGLGVTYWILWSTRLADLDADNRGLAERFVGAARDAPGGGELAALEAELVRPSGVSAAQVYRGSRLVWEGSVLDAPDPLDPAGLRGAAGARTVGGWRVYTAREVGLTVQTGRRLAALRATLRPFFYAAPPLAIGLTLLSGLLAWTAAGLALRPLERLTRAAREFTGSRLGEPPSDHLSSASNNNPDPLELAGRDEAATLAQSFAALLARLQGERAREQSFLAYAAHELRTPISALRAGLEAVQLERTLPSPETCARFYRDALRLENFAQNLLALARADAGEVRPAPLDLAALLADTYDRFQPLALERGYELAFATSPVTLSADARLLEQALGNLIANALRHAPAGSVELGCGAADGWSYLEVRDAGRDWDGLGDEGLGLRVVRSVAHAHAGRLEVRDGGSSGNGTRVRLWLPNGESAES